MHSLSPEYAAAPSSFPEALGAAPPAFRRFQLRRAEDVSGVSGIGVVVQGVQFDDGACVIRWVGDVASTVHHDSIQNVVTVHGHEGRTVVEWLDEAS